MLPIRESADELLARRRLEGDARRRERLHGLWLLAGGAAANRLEVAAQLARNRETIARWLDLYAAGGLGALLALAKPTAPANQGGIVLPAPVQEAIAARLERPEGERGYRALWQWARAEHGVAVSYGHSGLQARGLNTISRG